MNSAHESQTIQQQRREIDIRGEASSSKEKLAKGTCSLDEETKIRFWPKVEIAATEECWNWKSSHHGEGYGAFRLNGRLQNAHRISWVITFGEIPNGLFVLHKCDNPACVNPDHLFLGTASDNMKDRENKGRANHPRGKDNGQAKLTQEKADEIRLLYKKGNTSQRKLAAAFGVVQNTIKEILKLRAWTSPINISAH